MSESQDGPTNKVRTDGKCAVCGFRRDELTEIGLGSGFLQLCDECRPYIKEALDDVS